MSEHTPTLWFHRQAGEVSPRHGEAYDWIADHPGHGQHRKIIVARDSCSPEDFAFIVKAVNSHDALVNALEEADKALAALGVEKTHRVRWDVIRAALASIKEAV